MSLPDCRMSRMRITRTAATVATAVTLLLAGCSSDEDESSTSSGERPAASVDSQGTGPASSDASSDADVTTAGTDASDVPGTATAGSDVTSPGAASTSTSSGPADTVGTTPGGSGSGTTVPGSPSDDTAAPSSAPPSESTAAPTTAPPTAPVLRSDGIGAATFGSNPEEVVAQLEAHLGPPTLDETSEYPNAVDGQHLDGDGYAFLHPFARFLCYANGLCLNFGGPTPDALTWVGWSYSPGTPSPPFLATAGGVRSGMRWAEVVGQVEVFPNGCYGIGYGTTEGIDLEVVAEDAWFGDMGVSSPPVPTSPDPADVVITSMRAGAEPVFTEGDC